MPFVVRLVSVSRNLSWTATGTGKASSRVTLKMNPPSSVGSASRFIGLPGDKKKKFSLKRSNQVYICYNVLNSNYLLITEFPLLIPH